MFSDWYIVALTAQLQQLAEEFKNMGDREDHQYGKGYHHGKGDGYGLVAADLIWHYDQENQT